MAIKKNALYSSLWASCDELRGGMDASQYKDYVLTLLFMKYVSDKAASVTGSQVHLSGASACAVQNHGTRSLRTVPCSVITATVNHQHFPLQARRHGAAKRCQTLFNAVCLIQCRHHHA